MLELNQQTLTRLEELDALYIKAFESKALNIIKDYAEPSFLYLMARLIITCPRYFADARYRENKWEVIREEGNDVILHKSCIYQVIRLGLVRKTKISTDYTEEWTIRILPEKWSIKNIRRIDDASG